MPIPCLLDGCTKIISEKRLKHGALFCSNECCDIDTANRKVEARAAKSDYKAAHCKVIGCRRKFLDVGTTQGYCRKHAKEYGAYSPKYKKEYKTVRKIDYKIVKDFRTEICLRNWKQCKHFSKCSDTVTIKGTSAFRYQTNGGIDCWEAPPDRVPYASNLNTANVLVKER